MTAANGDHVSGTAEGDCSRDNPTAIEVECVVDYVSTGGTGRFNNASAEFTATMHSVRVALDPGPPMISYGDYPPPVIDDVVRLRRRLAGVPTKVSDRNLLIASWNIRSRRFVNRLIEAHARGYWSPDEAVLDALHRAGEELEDRLEGITAEAAA